MMTAPPAWKLTASCLVLIALAACLSYANAIDAAFIYDDYRDIVTNPNIRDFSKIFDPSTAVRFGDVTYFGGTEFFKLYFTRIVGYASFAVDYALWGVDPRGYHMTSLLFHVLTGFLVFSVALQLARRSGMDDRRQLPVILAGGAALLFVTHPVLTHAVTYTAQRVTVLATCFYLASIAAFLAAGSAGSRGGRTAWFGVSLAAAVLAMKTKEIAITLPVMIVLVDMAVLGTGFRKTLLRAMPYVLAASLVPLGHIMYENDPAKIVANATRGESFPRDIYFMNELTVLVTYLRLFLFPDELVFDRENPSFRSFLEPEVAGAAVFHIVLVIAAVAAVRLSRRRREPLLAIAGAGMLWFYVALATESSFIPIRDYINEYRLYLAAPGLSMAAVAVVMLAAGRFVPDRAPAVAAAVVCASAVVLGILAYQRNDDYGTMLSITQDTVRKAPNKARAWHGLGDAYRLSGRYAEAINAYRTSIALEPFTPLVYDVLGATYCEIGDFDNAEFWARKGAEYDGMTRDRENFLAKVAALRKLVATQKMGVDTR